MQHDGAVVLSEAPIQPLPAPVPPQDEVMLSVRPLEHTPNGPLLGCLGTLLMLVLRYRHSIDDKASTFLAPAPQTLDLQRKDWRSAYMVCVFALLALLDITQCPSADLALCTAICVVLLPLKVFTNNNHTQRYWIDYAVHSFWAVCACAIYYTRASTHQSFVLRLLLCHYLWTELSTQSLASLLHNHLLTNILVLVAFRTSLSTPPTRTLLCLSAGFVCLFCVRRLSTNDHKASAGKGAVIPTELTSVLLCREDEDAEVLCSRWDSGGGSGTGTGGGSDCSLAAPCEGCDVEQQEMPSDCWQQLLDSFIEVSPDEDDSSEPISQPTQSLPAFLQIQSASASPLSAMPPHSADLVAMSFDAMAQVELATGVVLWANPAFAHLSRVVSGHRPAAVGVYALQGAFLQQLPAGLRLLKDSFGIGENSIDVRSASQVVGGPSQEMVLWVLNWSEQGTTRFPVENLLPFARPNNNTAPTDEFPRASVCVDPKAQVKGKKSKGGKGSRQLVMLWQKYGKKTVTGPNGRVVRKYYKCHVEYCKAKLKVDVQHSTGERVLAEPTGERDARRAECV
eukprot:TRINITY_DN2572_c0_g1_i3.p1 TRINITY_DN2572_c0_g1~~TRINITY_DN2572_c0_g1_i3.p1  ORF type:complete len:566 (+),score=90.10 TRINITY_DN2572_c0_g1_i3:315-2012(+)